jgi:hypothetical protein
MISICAYRKMSEQEKSDLLNKAVVVLKEFASQGWRITMCEKLAAKRLGCSHTIISDASSDKSFKEFYNRIHNR